MGSAQEGHSRMHFLYDLTEDQIYICQFQDRCTDGLLSHMNVRANILCYKCEIRKIVSAFIIFVFVWYVNVLVCSG